MNDTPPDQKEAGDAPAGPRNPWVTWLVWLILAPVLYVLSIGPMWWLEAKGLLPEQTVDFVYYPLIIFGEEFPAPLQQYIGWWTPENAPLTNSVTIFE